MSDPLDSITQQGARKVFQALLDPRWTTTVVDFDGNRFICVTLSHPEHGKIDCFVARATAKWLGETLTRMASQ